MQNLLEIYSPTTKKDKKKIKDKFNFEKTTIFREDAIKFLKNLPSESVDLIITDPAYSGMNQHLKFGKSRIVGDYQNKIENNKWFEEFHDTPKNYEEFLNECFRVLKKDRHIFIMFDSFSMLTLAPLVRNHFNLKNIIVWDKVNIGMGHYFRRQSEFILFASKGKRPVSRRDMSDIWKIKRIYNAEYPTQKPVELFEAMIASSKHKEDKNFIVCDPFVGSGSSAIAAIKQRAEFIGADISDKAIDVCHKRVKSYVDNGIDIYQKNQMIDKSTQKKFW